MCSVIVVGSAPLTGLEYGNTLQLHCDTVSCEDDDCVIFKSRSDQIVVDLLFKRINLTVDHPPETIELARAALAPIFIDWCDL